MTLPTRKLGSAGLDVSAIGLGCMGMSQSYGPADEAESIATLHRSIELGCKFLDTGEVYGPYTNEELLGRALGSKRAQVTIAIAEGEELLGVARITAHAQEPVLQLPALQVILELALHVTRQAAARCALCAQHVAPNFNQPAPQRRATHD
jgi:hypothetical protein